MKKIVKTPFFWISLIIILIAIPISLYYLTVGSGGGMGLAGIIALMTAFITFVVLFIEQKIVKAYNPKPLTIWLIEVLILIFALFFIVISERKVIYTVDEANDWVVIVYVNEKFEKPEHTFPFNINYNIGDRHIIFINPDNQKLYDREFFTWGGYSSSGEELTVNGKNYWIRIIYHPRVKAVDKKIDIIKPQVENEIRKKL